MKFIHLSDLHIGKKLNEQSLLEDQKHILSQILGIIDEEEPGAVIIAGDIYDKQIPSAEAVMVFDWFISMLAKRKIPVMIISGNHDSAERIAFGARVMSAANIFFSPVYNGKIETVSLEDEFGRVNFYMLPFVKPSYVRRFFPEKEIESYDDAVKVAIEAMNPDCMERNVLISHQFITGANVAGSEEKTVGGLDNVNVMQLKDFDYVALGHIHGAQHIERETVRYCGTPLKYSFAEVNHKKSVTIVEMKEKGKIDIRTRELVPLHDLVEIKGYYDEITQREFFEKYKETDYYRIILKDEEEIPGVLAKLRYFYPEILSWEFDNIRSNTNFEINGIKDIESKSSLDILKEFYELRNGCEMSLEQTALAEETFEKIREEKA